MNSTLISTRIWKISNFMNHMYKSNSYHSGEEYPLTRGCSAVKGSLESSLSLTHTATDSPLISIIRFLGFLHKLQPTFISEVVGSPFKVWNVWANC